MQAFLKDKVLRKMSRIWSLIADSFFDDNNVTINVPPNKNLQAQLGNHYTIGCTLLTERLSFAKLSILIDLEVSKNQNL